MMSKFRYNKSIPLYFQLEETIRQKIVDKVYQRGQPIPAENQLQNEYNVSRETVRKAINELVLLGLLEKKRGKGTFVALPKITHRIGSIYGSTEELIARGMKPDTDFLESTEIKPPESIRKEMNINKGINVVKIARLRFADGEPVAILTSYLPIDIVPDIASTKFIDNSLYRTLEEKYNLTLHECDEIIEAGIVKGNEAKLLNLGKSGPVLVVKRLTYLDNARIIEKLVALYRSDKFKYQVKLKGRNESRLL